MNWLIERHWSYPRKVDTRLCASALIFHRAEIAQSGVSSLSVIKYFDVLEDSGFGCRDRLEKLGVDQLHLEATEERFHRRVVPTLPLRLMLGRHCLERR